ncbi:hypothetical protein [Ornithinimicrobium kibberense]
MEGIQRKDGHDRGNGHHHDTQVHGSPFGALDPAPGSSICRPGP